MRRTLFRHERKIVQALSEVIIPLPPHPHPVKGRGPNGALRPPPPSYAEAPAGTRGGREREGVTADEMGRLLDLVDDQVSYLTRDMAFVYRVCLWAFELGAFFYYGKLKLMTQMDINLRERYVAAWHNTWWSAKRTMKRFLETIIFMNYYSMPDVAQRVCGYAPKFTPPLGSRDFPSVKLIREIPEKVIYEDVDVCVIGSGAGGAVVGKELAEAGHSVLILEEGGFFTDSDFGDDTVSMIKKLYRAGGVSNTYGWPTIPVPVGCCVGGTTVINSGTCFRTPDPVFEKWVNQFGLSTWAPSNMRRHYDEVEKTVSVAPAQETVQGKSGVLFERGLHALGHEMKPLMRNAPNCCGSGVCAFGCPTNAKLSMQLNYIPLALQAGARIYTHCCAKQIVYKKRHAVEVVGQFESPEKKGPKIHVKAKVIVVSCGTLHTPILLKRSHVPNIGGQIGKNLTLHPAAKVMALFDEEVKGWEGIPQGYCSEALREEGILLEGTFIPPAITAASLLLTGRSHHETMEQYGHLAMFGMIVSDTSRGRIIRGIRDHAIAMYNINRVDVSKFRKGIKFLADVFFAAGAKRVFLPIHTLPEVTKEEGTRPIDLLRLRKKDIELYAFHPLCTCRMGADPREAALDSNARLYGLDNLFVADGSIFPTSLGVNPMLTIMAAGHKIAEHIHHDIL